MLIAVIAAGAAIYVAWSIFRKSGVLPAESEDKMPKAQRVVYNKYYVDELYDAVIRKPLDWISDMTYRFFELRVVDAVVNGVGDTVRRAGSVVRLIQDGTVGFYLFAMAIVVILLFLVKMF